MKRIVVAISVALVIITATPKISRASLENALAKPFTATCKDIGVHAFRFQVSRNGKVITNGWSEGEKFFNEWSFRWDPPQTLTLDKKNLVVVGKKSSVISAIEPEVEGPLGTWIWTYAINVELRGIVAAQVNAFNGPFGRGVKTRAIQLECKFDFSE